jgi:DNA repair protein RadC
VKSNYKNLNCKGDIILSVKMKMKELPVSDRPYEKLELKGSEALTDSELLAIILGNGTRTESAVDLARRVINDSESGNGIVNRNGIGNSTGSGIVGLYNITLEELKAIKGIGRVKAIRLKAIAELTKRISSKSNIDNKRYIKEPEDVTDFLMEEMRRYEKEVFRIVLLNTKNAVIRVYDVSIGTVNASLVNPSVAFREAVRTACTSVIFVHNHPSGDPTPSRNDITTTEILVKSGKLLGINVLDHIIIGDGKFVSLKNRGLM